LANSISRLILGGAALQALRSLACFPRRPLAAKGDFGAKRDFFKSVKASSREAAGQGKPGA
jgi:hypothetical protein